MVYILLGTGFEEVEALAPCDILRRGGVDVALVGVNGPEITGSHGITVRADLTVDRLDREALEMIVLPGGLGGVNSMLASPETLEAVSQAWSDGKYVAAICAAPTILAKLGISDGKRCVCYPGMEGQMGGATMVSASTVEDGKLLTGRGPGAALDFGLLLLEKLKGAETAAQVKAGMVYQPD